LGQTDAGIPAERPIRANHDGADVTNEGAGVYDNETIQHNTDRVEAEFAPEMDILHPNLSVGFKNQ
jgi:hypothetical protein